MVNCINLIIEMSPHFILGRENVPCVAEVVNRSLKADCTDYTPYCVNTKYMVLFSPDFKYKVGSFNLYIIDNYVKRTIGSYIPRIE